MTHAVSVASSVELFSACSNCFLQNSVFICSIYAKYASWKIRRQRILRLQLCIRKGAMYRIGDKFIKIFSRLDTQKVWKPFNWSEVAKHSPQNGNNFFKQSLMKLLIYGWCPGLRSMELCSRIGSQWISQPLTRVFSNEVRFKLKRMTTQPEKQILGFQKSPYSSRFSFP